MLGLHVITLKNNNSATYGTAQGLITCFQVTLLQKFDTSNYQHKCKGQCKHLGKSKVIGS